MDENKCWLKRAIQSAIKEYHRYWMVEPALDAVSGLSRYRPQGLGIPPETEATHFTHILEPYAEKLGISVNEYIEGYNDGTIKEPELDEYFLHDRGVRESGHDTTYRLEKKCADLATVDLNSLLYKYEIDIAPEAFAAGAPRTKSTANPMTSAEWYERARVRQARMDEYCWDEGKGMYFDYNTKTQRSSLYESVTTFWPMWAGCASEDQALKMMHKALPKFEVAGGLVSGTKESYDLAPRRQSPVGPPFGMAAAPDSGLGRNGALRLHGRRRAPRLPVVLHDDYLFRRLQWHCPREVGRCQPQPPRRGRVVSTQPSCSN
jgi:alpha,alpha-trehalase